MSFLFGGGVKTTTRADKIASFQSTACDFGTPLPIAYGTCKLAPNLINFQNYTTVENRTTVKTGKHSSSTSIDYNYYVYLELALCEGVIDGIGKVYSGDDTFASLAAFNANAGNSGAPLSLNRGDNDKPTTYMQSNYPALAVGYKNMAYLFGYVFLGTNSAGMPSYNFEVQGLLRQSGDGVDANPADIIIDLLKRIGHEEYIDTESFNNYRRYCAAADLLVSTPSTEFSEQKKCQEYIKELLDITNAYMFWSTNRFKIVPRDDRQHGSWRPDATIRYNITERDMAVQANGACVIYTRKDSSELYNRWSVEFTNRANGYEKEKVFFEDTDNIRAHGVRTAPNFSALWIHTKARAVVVAAMRARINKTEIIRYNFKIGWGIGSLLEPGDLITISYESAGIKQQLCMVEKISEDSIGMLTITALSRNLDDSGITYIIPESTYNTIKYNVEPGDVATPLIITPPQDLVTSNSGIEIWLAIQGQSKDWGGCDVYASTKDGAYTFYNKHKHNSNYGYILTDMSADASSVDVKFTNIGTVSIIEGSAENAADGLTDIWVNGECMSYSQSQLIAPNTYRLAGLERGKYQSGAKAHAIGDGFALLDGNLFCIQLTRNYLDKTLFLKFPSFNNFEKCPQSVNDVDYYNHRVMLYDIPNVTNLSAHAEVEKNSSTDDNGETVTTISRRYLVVNWIAPDWNEYMNARVYYKKEGESWIFIGTATNGLSFDVNEAGNYTVAVCTQDLNGYTETPDDSAQTVVAFDE